MREIVLVPVPNQTFNFEIIDATFQITLNTMTDTLLVCSMSVTDASSGTLEELFSGYQVVAGRPLIPFKSMLNGRGNFYFVTPNDEIPHWEQFGTRHKLFYLNDEDLREYESIRYPKKNKS